MHDMIEMISVGGNSSRQKKLLFLTGEQADQIAQTSNALDAMLRAFEVGKPQLVINLLESGGFGDWTGMRTAEGWAGLNSRWAPGVRVSAPFESAEEERAAEMRLDLFMSDILIPLAAQTKAVVICCAIPNLCILSASFTRMFNAVKAKWHGKPPFTVLSITNDMIALYSSNKYPKVPKGATWTDPRDTPLDKRYEGKVWKSIMTASRMWRERHERIASTLDKITEAPLECDLDGNAFLFMIVDDGGRGQFAMLMNALMRHLRADLPSIAIKTGCSRKRPLGFGDPSSLEIVADVASSGTPVIFLDVRPVAEGSLTGAKSRGQLISKAKRAVMKRNQLLRTKQNLCDTLDICMLSYWHEVLYGDGDPSTEENFPGGHNDDEPTPLHRAIASKMKAKKNGGRASSKDDAEASADPVPVEPSKPTGTLRSIRRDSKDAVSAPGLADTAPKAGGRVRIHYPVASPPSTPPLSSSPTHEDGRSGSPSEEARRMAGRRSSLAPPNLMALTRSSPLLEGEQSEDIEDEEWRDEPASQQQVVAVSDWVTEEYFRQGWETLTDHAERVARGETFEEHGRKLFKEPMLAMSVACRTLLSSENLCARARP